MKKKDLSFSNLIRALDRKWGHTYEDPEPEPEGTELWKQLIQLPLNHKAEIKED